MLPFVYQRALAPVAAWSPGPEQEASAGGAVASFRRTTRGARGSRSVTEQNGLGTVHLGDWPNAIARFC